MLDTSEGFLPPIEDRQGSFVKKTGLAGAAVAAAAVGDPLLDAASTFAPPSPENARSLPALGQTIKCSCNAFGATLVVSMPPPMPKLNFVGSVVFKVLIGGADYVRLQVLDLTFEAAHPMFGKIRISLPDTDPTPTSILSAPTAPGGDLTARLLPSFKAAFERCADTPGPFSFTTLAPAGFTGISPKFPPPPQSTNRDGSPAGGRLYRAASPIRLGTVEADGRQTLYARLDDMAISLGEAV
ncbi:hypothetical protein [Amycolatopsis speibonae]|uniref:Twin-arginine translocation signal domain-containing protein n=1 Tax=Amycolatopsis speibonae TaxID=1450224 RepID=A0ABV7P5D9_9PSEU